MLINLLFSAISITVDAAAVFLNRMQALIRFRRGLCYLLCWAVCAVLDLVISYRAAYLGVRSYLMFLGATISTLHISILPSAERFGVYAVFGLILSPFHALVVWFFWWLLSKTLLLLFVRLINAFRDLCVSLLDARREDHSAYVSMSSVVEQQELADATRIEETCGFAKMPNYHCDRPQYMCQKFGL